jgi:dolichyl-phosphate-mannose-protein mannosyltransferase
MNIKRLLKYLNRHEYTGLSLLILIILALHFATIMQPAEPVFDEKYYVPAARYILQGSGTDRIEHPPLAQLIITGGIFIFGDNPFGWRFFSIVFGADEEICISGYVFTFL